MLVCNRKVLVCNRKVLVRNRKVPESRRNGLRSARLGGVVDVRIRAFCVFQSLDKSSKLCVAK